MGFGSQRVADKSAAWLRKDKDTWSAKIKRSCGVRQETRPSGPNIGRDYEGLLSELAHPTRTAAENSVTLGGVRKGDGC